MDMRRADPASGSPQGTIRRWVRLKDRSGLTPAAELVGIGDALPPGSARAMERMGPISSITWALTLLGDVPETREGWWLLETASNHMDQGFSSETPADVDQRRSGSDARPPVGCGVRMMDLADPEAPRLRTAARLARIRAFLEERSMSAPAACRMPICSSRVGPAVLPRRARAGPRRWRAASRTDAIYRIASMTKALTSAALMLLEEGKVALNDPVTRVIPSLPGLASTPAAAAMRHLPQRARP